MWLENLDTLTDILTPREDEVMKLMAEGFDNTFIANRLFIIARTVEHHIHEIFSKYGVNEIPGIQSRVAAVIIYLRNKGLLNVNIK